MNMIQLRGVVHGTTIQLDSQPGLPDGQEVVVHLSALTDSSQGANVDALNASFGTWTDDETGLDEFLRWTREQRDLPARGAGE
jgi:hypothetical protein